jgi:hydrogenase maturation protease
VENMSVWHELERPGPETAVVDGVEVCAGSRVRLRPRARRDAWDTMLAGKLALVERLEEDLDGGLHVVVSVADHAGRALEGAHPAHRFFFALDEIEPLTQTRVLVAGIGNIFLGDDGFGCAVAAALEDAPMPASVDVEDFGIRGLDLAYALAAYDGAVLVDAVPLGEPPGTVAVIEPELNDEQADIETHGMDPVRVLRLARELGGLPRRTIVVGCQPQTIADPEGDDVVVELSDPVRAAVQAALPLVLAAVHDLLQETTKGGVET